jgi:GTPase SAR1 family protein
MTDIKDNHFETQDTGTGSDSGPADVWSLIGKSKKQQEQKLTEQDSSDANSSAAHTSHAVHTRREANILFVGDKGSGKSTLIQHLMRKNKGGIAEVPNPTSSLDYKYTRTTVGISAEKQLTHVWELGGGRHLLKLIEIAVTSQSVEHSLIVVTVDLSKPNDVVNSLVYWLKKVRSHVSACVAKLNSRDVTAKVRIAKRATSLLGDHKDRDGIALSMIPMLVVGTKFDIFKQQETYGRILNIVMYIFEFVRCSYFFFFFFFFFFFCCYVAHTTLCCSPPPPPAFPHYPEYASK